MKFIYPVMCVLLGCSTQNKNEGTIESSDVSEGVSNSKTAVNEKFNAFFDRFSADSVFQESRISFPLSYYVSEIAGGTEEYIIEDGEWNFETFYLDKEAANRDIDAFEGVVKEINSEEVMYLRQGIDNGIRVEYYFEMNDKEEWYLMEVIDKST